MVGQRLDRQRPVSVVTLLFAVLEQVVLVLIPFGESGTGIGPQPKIMPLPFDFFRPLAIAVRGQRKIGMRLRRFLASGKVAFRVPIVCRNVGHNQMQWVDAPSVVAGVAENEIDRNFSVGQAPRQPMRVEVPTAGKKASVPF